MSGEKKGTPSHPFHILARLFTDESSEQNKAKSSGKVAVVLNHQQDVWDRSLLLTMQDLVRSPSKDDFSPSFEVYSPNNNPRAMKADVAWRLTQRQDSLDAVVTSGPWVSVAMMSTQRHWRKQIPLVFVGVEDPTGWGLVDNETRSGSFVTGVKRTAPAIEPQVRALRTLRPAGQRTLILYNGDLEKAEEQPANSGMRQKLTNQLVQAGWRVEAVPLLFDSDVTDEVYHKLLRADAAIMLNDSTVMMHQRKLNSLCARAKTVLIGMNLHAVVGGAACGLGSRGGDYAPQVVDILKKLLVDKKKPVDIPVAEFSESSKVWYNPLVLHEQGIVATDEAIQQQHVQSVLEGACE